MRMTVQELAPQVGELLSSNEYSDPWYAALSLGEQLDTYELKELCEQLEISVATEQCSNCNKRSVLSDEGVCFACLEQEMDDIEEEIEDLKTRYRRLERKRIKHPCYMK